MIDIKLLAFVAVLALYFKWIYGSPLAARPSNPEDCRLKRATPLILFILSGLSLTISLLFQKVGFFIFFSMSALFLLAVPVTTFWLKRKK